MSVEDSKDPCRIVVVMGPMGCGKSTVGSRLAEVTGADYIEGDDYHTLENKAKMAAGDALTDEDRWPWLQSLGVALFESHGNVIASCSALKKAYRDTIRQHAVDPVVFIQLSGTRQLLASRLSARKGHFMNIDLLESQIATLEPLYSTELGFAVDIDASVVQIVEQIHKRLALDTICFNTG